MSMTAMIRRIKRNDQREKEGWTRLQVLEAEQKVYKRFLGRNWTVRPEWDKVEFMLRMNQGRIERMRR